MKGNEKDSTYQQSNMEVLREGEEKTMKFGKTKSL